MPSILVIGSTNTDLVIKTERIPRPGETVLGEQFMTNPGGKGANQAVAAARLGGQVSFITKLGTDLFGEQGRAQLVGEGIAAEYLLTDNDLPSGVALITVDAHGENNIVVAPGANGALTAADVAQAAPAFAAADVVLAQLEVPLAAVEAAAQLAALHGKRFILNPAPAPTQPLPAALLRGLYLLTPNETEAEALTGIAVTDEASAAAAAQVLHSKGVENVVITLGSQGASLHTAAGARRLPTTAVRPVDSTAAGDVFNGALAVALGEGAELADAVRFANAAAAISVTRLGAQASAPYRHELQAVSQ